jgi:hypothetical protein
MELCSIHQHLAVAIAFAFKDLWVRLTGDDIPNVG